MNADDLPEIKFTGIPRDALSGVSEDAQRRVASAFPDVRLLWNNKIQRHQCVFEEPGNLTKWINGEVIVGWRFMAGDFPPAMCADEIVAELRRRQDFNMNELKKLGFKDAGEYADHLFKQMQKQIDDDADALCDDVFAVGEKDTVRSIGGLSPGQTKNMNAASDDSRILTLDRMSGRRDLRRGKVLPYLRKMKANEIPNLRVGT